MLLSLFSPSWQKKEEETSLPNDLKYLFKDYSVLACHLKGIDFLVKAG